jgi:hypothetical protein
MAKRRRSIKEDGGSGWRVHHRSTSGGWILEEVVRLVCLQSLNYEDFWVVEGRSGFGNPREGAKESMDCNVTMCWRVLALMSFSFQA